MIYMTLRARLVYEMAILLGIEMSIIGNIRSWNVMIIPTLLFGDKTYTFIRIEPK